MNKLWKYFNWCVRKKKDALTYLDKKQYVLDFIEELVHDTRTNIDDIFYLFIKKRLDENDLNK